LIRLFLNALVRVDPSGDGHVNLEIYTLFIVQAKLNARVRLTIFIPGRIYVKLKNSEIRVESCSR
jgi:hypothetical protein